MGSIDEKIVDRETIHKGERHCALNFIYNIPLYKIQITLHY